MWFFTPKKKSVDEPTIKILMSVNSQRNLKNFLEAEKNMFDHLNIFIKILFLLNGGSLVALLEFRPDFHWCMFLLSLGIEFSLFFYLISFIFLNRSMKYIEDENYIRFKKSRRYSHNLLYCGVWFSILFFIFAFFVFAVKMNYIPQVYIPQFLIL